MIMIAVGNDMIGAPSTLLPLTLSNMIGNNRQYMAFAVASFIAVDLTGKPA
jgi:fructose-specific phosphotransferase system IIC component